jgi:cytochrome c-type biogenesis protein CcmH
MKRMWLMLALLACLPAGAMAKEAPEMAADPALEKRVMAISEDLRCLVCQNESLAASHAELALDLRQQVREKLKAGASDKEVVDFMVQRYGDFVLYKPPVKPYTLVLWYGPFVLLGIGAATLFMFLRRRMQIGKQAQVPMSDEEKQRVETMLKNGIGEDKA